MTVPRTRAALLALSFGGFGLATGEFVTLGLLPNVASGLHVSIPAAGHLVSSYALGVVVGAPLLTVAGVRLPRKVLLIAMVLALAAGNFASAVAPSFTWLLVIRFLSGLPHGAYFGAATVAAATQVEESRRSQAMATVFAGLTVANIVGVPASTFLGQQTSWRVVYAVIGVLEVGAAGAIAVTVPQLPSPVAEGFAQIRHELAAFKDSQIWLALGIATIGGGALFATLSYITPMMTRVAGFAPSSITYLLVLAGIGMTAGNFIGARLADRSVMPTIYASLGAEILVAVYFYFGAHRESLAIIAVVIFPLTFFAMVPALQSRIVGLAGGAPNLAAASVHSAFNIANSIGAALGGVVIAAGYGYSSPNLVAAGLAVLGLGIAVVAGRSARSRAATGAHRAPVLPGEPQRAGR